MSKQLSAMSRIDELERENSRLLYALLATIGYVALLTVLTIVGIESLWTAII